MVRVMGRKILGVQDFHIHCSLSLSSGINLGTLKSKVKFFNGFPFDPKFVKI